MIKQRVIVASMGVMALTSSWVFAAREEHIFEVSVDIPTLGFYVIPAEADWIHREQILPWNLNTSSLGGLRKTFDVKHDSSAIEARLESEPYLSNGSDDIYLRVRFNDKELSHDPQPRQVVSAAEAMAGSRVRLDIDPKVPTGGYKPGSYYGNVMLIFSAAAP
ncbi:CS1 type fimbrial major subunit [Pseudomonas sp. NPDC087697]|uniref:CS1 type fimbrial major subunit n=1 Tax=Pseudomonas sp. NPDC087697 TaxID=3364447 RepID=UPI0038145D9C